MIESEWLSATDPTLMMEFLEGRASERRVVLVAVECLRQLSNHTEGLVRENHLKTCNLAESLVDGPFIRDRLWQLIPVSSHFKQAPDHFPWRWAATLVAKTKSLQVLRDIFGNPFRSVIADPSWLSSTVSLLAEGIYAARDFSAMPILADALQDAGCDSDDILSHLRDPNATHVRGCWALDLVLGKS